MKNLRFAVLAAAGALLIVLLAYHEVAAKRAAAPTQKVMVAFEGPWAFATDPSDPARIFAFAPKTATHQDLMVKFPGETEILRAGVYEVLLHAVPEARSHTAIDRSILQAKIDAQGVQHALADRLDRYAIRLPRPEAYVAVSTGRMRAGPAFPPGPETEKRYAMDISLRYSATTLAGFTVSGSPDTGSAFHPVSVDGPNLSFVIQPLPGQIMDECELHNREAFRDLAKLVQLKMFVDFEKFGSDCQATDPQNPATTTDN